MIGDEIIIGVEIIADFELDLKNYVKEKVIYLGNKSIVKNLKKEFNLNDKTYWNKSIRDILHDYYNFLDRIIFPTPKEVILTEIIKNNINYTKYKPIIDNIRKKLELGCSVNEYLSDKHNKNYKFKDIAQHLFGIHHLHLGQLLLNREIKRSDYLLILQIDEQSKKVYFLDIVQHAEFKGDNINYYKYTKILVD